MLTIYFQRCSYDQLSLRPYGGNGIITVEVDSDLSSLDMYEAEAIAKERINEMRNQGDYPASSEYDHQIMCLPEVSSNSIAYAGIKSSRLDQFRPLALPPLLSNFWCFYSTGASIKPIIRMVVGVRPLLPFFTNLVITLEPFTPMILKGVIVTPQDLWVLHMLTKKLP